MSKSITEALFQLFAAFQGGDIRGVPTILNSKHEVSNYNKLKVWEKTY